MEIRQHPMVTNEIDDNEVLTILREVDDPLHKYPLMAKIFLARCEAHDFPKDEEMRLLAFLEFYGNLDGRFRSTIMRMIHDHIIQWTVKRAYALPEYKDPDSVWAESG